MIPNLPILPDSMFYGLAIMGALASAVYIASASRTNELRREDKLHELNAAVRANKTSDKLADIYTAVAHGDPVDRDYWSETARAFAGEEI